MKVSVELLKNYMKKASLNGEITSTNLDFLEDGLHSAAYDAGTVVLSKIFMPASSFEEYEPLGEMAIRNTSLFLKFLSSFEETVELSRPSDYILELKENKKKASIILAEKTILDNLFGTGNLPTFEAAVDISVSKEFLNNSIRDVKIVDDSRVALMSENNDFFISSGVIETSDYIENAIDISESEKHDDARIVLGANFANLVKTLNHNATIRFGTNTPLLLVEEADLYNFECFIAPITD